MVTFYFKSIKYWISSKSIISFVGINSGGKYQLHALMLLPNQDTKFFMTSQSLKRNIFHTVFIITVTDNMRLYFIVNIILFSLLKGHNFKSIY